MTYWHLLWMFVLGSRHTVRLGLGTGLQVRRGCGSPPAPSAALPGAREGDARADRARCAHVQAMSRWRRQQRKRAIRRRLAERDTLFRKLSERVTEYVNHRLKHPTGKPSDCAAFTEALLERIAPRPTFEVKARMGESGRNVMVDVTVRDPSPALAAALLEAGGKWV